MALFPVRRNNWFWVTAAAGAVAAYMVLCWPAAVARGYPPIHPWHLVACYVAPCFITTDKGVIEETVELDDLRRIAKLSRKPDHWKSLLGG